MQRAEFQILMSRMKEPQPLIQVEVGARQVGR